MSDANAKLFELEPKPLARLMDELAALSRRVAAGEPLRRPAVTLHLRSGRELTGLVLAVAEAHRGAVALLHLPGFDRAPASDVAYVPLESIEAVTVHEAARLDEPAEGARPAPGRLDFRRRVAAWEAAMHAALGALIAVELPELHDADLEPLAALVEQVAGLFERLGKESLGREALRTKVERIRVAVGSQPSAALHDKTLVLTTVHAAPRRMSRAALEASIESVL